jgi:hypothetical protein
VGYQRRIGVGVEVMFDSSTSVGGCGFRQPMDDVQKFEVVLPCGRVQRVVIEGQEVPNAQGHMKILTRSLKKNDETEATIVPDAYHTKVDSAHKYAVFMRHSN